MRVKLKGDISGTRNGRRWPPRGAVVELPDDEAQSLCSNGMAEAVPVEDAPPPVETATAARAKGKPETR